MIINKFWNMQMAYECQLVALWNVALWYNMSVPEQFGYDYYNECKLANALYPGLINHNRLVYSLRDRSVYGIRGTISQSWYRNNIPAVINMHNPDVGLSCGHTVCSVDVTSTHLILANYLTDGRMYEMSLSEVVKQTRTVPYYYDKRQV